MKTDLCSFPSKNTKYNKLKKGHKREYWKYRKPLDLIYLLVQSFYFSGKDFSNLIPWKYTVQLNYKLSDILIINCCHKQ